MANDTHDEFLSELKEFVDFTYSELDKLKLKTQYRRKKAVLLPMYINACDMADSVYILLKNERVNAAQNLIRSLQKHGSILVSFLSTVIGYGLTHIFMNQSLILKSS